MIRLDLLSALGISIFPMVVGMLWYGPIFGRIWREEVKSPPHGPAPIAGSIVAAVLQSVGLMFLMLPYEINSPGAGAVVGLIVWVAFVATSAALTSLFEGRSRTLYLLNAGYNLVSLVGMGALHAIF